MDESKFYGSNYIPSENCDEDTPVGEPIAPAGWTQEKADKLNRWEDIKLYIFLGVFLLCLLAIGVIGLMV